MGGAVVVWFNSPFEVLELPLGDPRALVQLDASVYSEYVEITRFISGR